MLVVPILNGSFIIKTAAFSHAVVTKVMQKRPKMPSSACFALICSCFKAKKLYT